MPLRVKVVWFGASVALLFLVDRLTKWLAIHSLPREGFFLVPRLTGVILERNQGIAYSIPLPKFPLIFAVFFITVILVALLIRAYRRGEQAAAAAFGLIIVGAFSNLLDRLRYDYVIDMIVLTGWPVFNLADVMILAGALWLAIRIFKKKKPA